MADITPTKLVEDMMGLRSAASLALKQLEVMIDADPRPSGGAIEAANALYAALHPDTDVREDQERLYMQMAAHIQNLASGAYELAERKE